MPLFTRADRDTEREILGAGGSLMLRQINAAGQIVPDSVYFDIQRYALKHIFLNTLRTHSGHNGGARRARTGIDWRFTATLQAPSSNFIEMYLGNWRGVAVTFNMGDPEAWSRHGIDQLTYRADNVLLGQVQVVNDAHTGKGLVTAEIEGEGNSNLWGYIGNTPISAALWP